MSQEAAITQTSESKIEQLNRALTDTQEQLAKERATWHRERQELLDRIRGILDATSESKISV